ncbi:MAG: NAD-glutamate dehydrogenase, partial [Pseudomonadota bacterium]
MARPLSATAKRVLKELTPSLSTRAFGLAELLIGEANSEDVSLVSPETLAQMVNAAAACLSAQSGTKSQIRVETGEHDETIVVAVNKNMPFLFDSILGEINSSGIDARLVVHPVADVHHDAQGFEIDDGIRRTVGGGSGVKTSIVACVLEPASADKRDALEVGMKATIAQVKAAVAGWKPMLERIGQAVDELQTGVLPAKKSDVAEAIAFLDWLRSDNFTFLGMRDYDFVGGQARGKLQRGDTKGLGILADPDFRILRRGNEAFTTTPQIRAFLNSRDVLIVTKANTKSLVHRRAYLDYIGVKQFTGQLSLGVVSL